MLGRLLRLVRLAVDHDQAAGRVPVFAGDGRVLAVGGLDGRFWDARVALAPAYPRGVELLLACGDRLAAVPRTTRVALEG